MIAYFWVFVGGGLGSMCRFGIANLMARFAWTFPWATFTANVLSCIVLGVLYGFSMRGGVNDSLRFLVMTGFCGGFSTFSTFSAETFFLFQTGQVGQGLLNIFLSLLVCMVCIYLGVRLVQQ